MQNSNSRRVCFCQAFGWISIPRLRNKGMESTADVGFEAETKVLYEGMNFTAVESVLQGVLYLKGCGIRGESDAATNSTVLWTIGLKAYLTRIHFRFFWSRISNLPSVRAIGAQFSPASSSSALASGLKPAGFGSIR